MTYKEYQERAEAARRLAGKNCSTCESEGMRASQEPCAACLVVGNYPCRWRARRQERLEY